MSNIITAGCSFTKYKWACWPNFVKWFEPSGNIINVGSSGSSNETIMRSVYNAVNKFADIKKVYIMWSGTNRYEIIHDSIDENLKKPIKEDQILSGKLEETNESYAVAKIAGVKLIEAFNRQYKTNYICLMPCNLFGPNDNYDLQNSHFLPALIKKIFMASKKKKGKIFKLNSLRAT